MELIIYILYSVNNNFKVNYYYKIKINKKVGEGTYGLVYEINKNMVIKVFKNYTNLNENKDDKKIIPNKNENRELNFFISYLKSNVKNSYIIDINAIGIIKFITGSKLKIINMLNFIKFSMLKLSFIRAPRNSMASIVVLKNIFKQKLLLFCNIIKRDQCV